MSDSIKIKCASCGAPLVIDSSNDVVMCEYCGSVYRVADLLNESEQLRMLKFTAKQQKEIEEKHIEREREKDRERKESQEKERVINKSNRFREGLLGKIVIGLIIGSLISAVYMFIDKRPFAGVMYLITTGLFIATWLIGSQMIKVDLSKAGLFALIGLLLLPPSTYLGLRKIYPKYSWPNNALAGMISKPKSKYGIIKENNSNQFEIYVDKISEDYFEQYVEDCKKKGFNNKTVRSGDSFIGYTDEEHELTVYYWPDDKQMGIRVLAPKKATAINWGSIYLAEYIPNDKFDAYIETNAQRQLGMRVYNKTQDYFNDYKKKCIELGYVCEAKDSLTEYEAYREDGVKIFLAYDDVWERFDIVVKLPEKDYYDIEWPKSELVSVLPIPKSLHGYVYTESETLYIVYIANTTKEEYDEYVKSCMDAGFDYDYSKYDKMFLGHTEDGYSVTVDYKDFRLMSIDINNWGTKKDDKKD